MSMVEEYFGSMRKNMDEQFGYFGEVEKKLGKIQKGSLKTLIYYYTEQEKQFDQ